MADRAREGNTLAQYILGSLSERERERLEEEYFEDDDVFEQMLIAEDELIDAYVAGQLSTDECAQFEKNFLSSQRADERVQFARALVSAVSDARPAAKAREVESIPPSVLTTASRTGGAALRFAFAAVALAFIVGFTWLLIERGRIRDELRRLQDERAMLSKRAQQAEEQAASERARSEELLAQLEGERARGVPAGTPGPERLQQPQGGQPSAYESRLDEVARHGRPPTTGSSQPPLERNGERPRNSVAMFTFTLTPGLMRGGGGRVLNVRRDASLIVLRLNINSARTGMNGELSYVGYRAVIETVGGREVWRAKSIRQTDTGDTITLPALPARVLPPGDYILSLSGQRQDGGFEGVADYPLRVIRK